MKEKTNFANSLKELLLINNLTIQSFSKAIGINRRSITWWFGSRSPKLESLIKIANYFNCSIDFLIGRRDDANYHLKSYDEVFFNRYTELKENHKLTDYRISKLCNIRTSTITKWKNGVSPEFEILVKLTDIFDCSFDYLVGGN